MNIKDWKKFYKNERENKEEQIKRISKDYWKRKKTSREIIKVLKKGIVSFPHTKLTDSLKPIIEILTAIYILKKEKIVLIGVLHRTDKNPKKYEFSLDNFIAISKIFAKENKLKLLKIEKIFHEKMIINRKEANVSKYIRKLIKQAKEIKKKLDNKTVLLITGDPFHFNQIDYRKIDLKKILIKNLKLCYLKKDYIKFFYDCFKIHGDHIAPSIISSEILGKNLKIKIFCLKLTSYKKEHSMVSSVVYGVSK